MTSEKTPDSAASALSAGFGALLPCPFCGGPVTLEQSTERYSREHGQREYWGVVCRNTINLGGTCCTEQVPSASKEAAVARWNMRNGKAPNALFARTETRMFFDHVWPKAQGMVGELPELPEHAKTPNAKVTGAPAHGDKQEN